MGAADAASAGQPPLVVGLTGSIAMGKTETGRMFERLGCPVFDADAVVHTLYARQGRAVAPVGELFPEAIVDGAVDRAALAAAVLGDPERLQALEAVVHPLVAAERQAFLEEARRNGREIVVLDIPLLFETARQDDVDAVVVVSAPAETQRQRALARPGMTEAKLDAILARQMPDADKRRLADFVVDTGQGLDHAFAQVKDIVQNLRSESQPTQEDSRS